MASRRCASVHVPASFEPDDIIPMSLVYVVEEAIEVTRKYELLAFSSKQHVCHHTTSVSRELRTYVNTPKSHSVGVSHLPVDESLL